VKKETVGYGETKTSLISLSLRRKVLTMPNITVRGTECNVKILRFNTNNRPAFVYHGQERKVSK